MAAQFFAGADPIGQRVLIQDVVPSGAALGPEIPWQVVGVVADERVRAIGDKSAGVYVTVDQSPTTFVSLIIRTRVDPRTLQRTIADAVHEINRDQALPDVQTLSEIKASSMQADRLRTMLLFAFAGVAVLLAAVGLYGVISYSVTKRTREIGVRTALGATTRGILLLITKEGMTLVAMGVAIGAAAALALTDSLSSFLFGVTARDPLAFALSAVLLTIVALVACYVPARRAARLDSLVALRYE
jgi:putative ABC transport system permease protein